MGIFKRFGTVAGSVASKLFGGGKAAKTGTSETLEQQQQRRKKLADDIRDDIAAGKRRLDEAIEGGARGVRGAVHGTFHPGPKFGPTIKSGLKAFLLGAPYDAFSSSNVRVIQYDPLEQHLYVRYKTGPWYRYHGVSTKKATGFWYATSKGIEVWNELRVRGSAVLHKHKYEPCGAPPDYLPLPG